MNRRFRLAALERLRAARLDEAVRALATARAAFAEAGRRRDAVSARLDVTAPAGRSTPEEVARAALHRAYLRERLADAETAVSDAAGGVDLALQAWRAARADARVVEALHGRHRATLVAADARHDQLVLDDVAAQAVLREPLLGGAR